MQLILDINHVQVWIYFMLIFIFLLHAYLFIFDTKPSLQKEYPEGAFSCWSHFILADDFPVSVGHSAHNTD